MIQIDLSWHEANDRLRDEIPALKEKTEVLLQSNDEDQINQYIYDFLTNKTQLRYMYFTTQRYKEIAIELEELFEANYGYPYSYRNDLDIFGRDVNNKSNYIRYDNNSIRYEENI